MDSSPTLGNEATSKPHGRLRIALLDELTIELPTNRDQQRAYRCAGPGCNKSINHIPEDEFYVMQKLA